LIKKGLISGHLDLSRGADPVEEALRVIFEEPGISSVVVGTLNPSHLRSNVAAADRVLAP
jgi:aryl-alcohol dehydrogenase-like predicted oxidoreductase